MLVGLGLFLTIKFFWRKKREFFVLGFFFNEKEKEVLSEPRKQREKVIICFGLLTASPVPHKIRCLQFK